MIKKVVSKLSHSQIKVFKMEERLNPDAELIYKKMGEQKYNKLVQDMKLIAGKFKERAQRTKAEVAQPPTPSSEVNSFLFWITRPTR